MSAGVNSASKQAQEPCHETPGVEHSMAQTTSCCPSSRRAYLTVAVLFLINLLNYMDRFTIAGLLDKIQTYFNISDNNSYAGLLQTVFICSYMVLAPIFGYLGDRYRRKYIMAAGILVWSATVFASSLLNSDSFWYFLALRGVVGIGEASYSTVAPTLIADLFTGDMRSRMLSVFYFAIPAGSGLGYIVGSEVAKAFGGHWQWGMRVTPVLGGVCVLLCILVVHEPPRGAIERGANPNAISASNVHVTTSWWSDVKYLWTVKSFVWLDLGFTCVAFVTGALAFWAPKYILYSTKVQGLDIKESSISFTFGVITCTAGIVGVWLGAEVARRYRVRNGRADALVCALGLLSCTPLLYGALVLAPKNVKAAYALVFFGELLLCMNWAPVGDMVLYVIIPPRRSTAGAIQILVSHLFGDAGSPWLIGKISDIIRGDSGSAKDHQISMEYSLLITTFVCILGGFFFIMCAFYLVSDRQKADDLTRAHCDGSSLLDSVASRAHGPETVGSENRALVDESSDESDDNESVANKDTRALVVPVQVHNLTEDPISNGHDAQVV